MTNENAGSESRVAEHYQTANLSERILAAFEAAGKRREGLTAEDLSSVDEFHVGGREATEAVAAQMKLRPEMKLLDIGSGIGGPARYFAGKQQCLVTGIDLTEEFVRAAQSLSEVVGLANAVNFQQGSALQMPFSAGSFDGAYIFHVGMNIENKAKLFAEVKRVLRAGGIFAIFDIMRTGEGELEFPVPWAGQAEHSFLASPAEYRDDLLMAGFAILGERARREFAIEFLQRMRRRAEEPGAKLPGLPLMMGESAMSKMGNVMKGLQSRAIAPVEMFAQA